VRSTELAVAVQPATGAPAENAFTPGSRCLTVLKGNQPWRSPTTATFYTRMSTAHTSVDSSALSQTKVPLLSR
jgi:hypothetical protein